MEEHLGHPLSQCYQCGKCSAGCPAAYTMDEPPNRVIRFLQLGLYDRVLEQNSYWVCSSCETCTARCPRNVEVKEIMELLRHDAYRRGVTSGERVVFVFHKAFLKTVKWFGRLYEPGLIILNNLLSGHFFKDVAAVPRMLLKGKIKLFPGRGADNAAVRRIFKYSREEAPRGEV
ncbi:MAG: 4Fe-4S dicluster domain-containing protein [bacterium]